MQIREDLSLTRQRASVIVVAILVGLAVLHIRLIHLQLVGGSHWRQMAENNRLRNLPLESARGQIYDRQGRVLAHDVPAWQALMFPNEAQDLNQTVLFLARIGLGKAATLREQIRARSVGLAPMVIGEDLSWAQVARIRAHQSSFPELSVVRRFRRQYPFAAMTSHAVGYLRPATERELATHDYSPDTLVGATGVEAAENQVLSGRAGERWVVVSAVGQQLGVVRERAPVVGDDLTLTLDLDLQEIAVKALGTAAGAIVALEPYTGAVRVLYSSPSFDPNIFVGRLTREEWDTIRSDPLHPMQNRCTQGVYPPASTVKPFLVLGGLADEVITDRWTVGCQGYVTLHGHPFRCWQRWGHGRVGLERSLEVSCDSYYYHLGQRLGIERIAFWLHKFGFGELSGDSFPGENAGLVGTPEWKRRAKKEPWYPGEGVSVSIGQGPVDSTVLQVARACAALANGGRLVTPYLVAGRDRVPPHELSLDQAHLATVKRGLWRVVHGRNGTADVLADLPVAGKTGTAQVMRLEEGQRSADLPPHQRHHAWFMGWAPADNPAVAIAVVVEHGGEGGTVAAPVAGQVLRAVLADHKGSTTASQPSMNREGSG
jgi:penicillin-binding protein 2